jgi:hypothetical protein
MKRAGHVTNTKKQEVRAKFLQKDAKGREKPLERPNRRNDGHDRIKTS